MKKYGSGKVEKTERMKKNPDFYRMGKTERISDEPHSKTFQSGIMAEENAGLTERLPLVLFIEREWRGKK